VLGEVDAVLAPLASTADADDPDLAAARTDRARAGRELGARCRAAQ
jgi:hypothetical protein